MLDKPLRAVVYCRKVRCVLLIVEQCSEDFDDSIRLLTIMVVLESDEFRRHIQHGAQRGSQISTGREDIACGSAVLPTQSEGLGIELSDFEGDIATLKW